MKSARPQERGAALITVLLIVSIMAGVSVALMDDVRYSLKRTGNAALQDNAFWYAQGAEELAKEVIWRSHELNPNTTTRDEPWARRGQVFPIEGGQIQAVIEDGANCFNLNSILYREEEGERREIGLEQFRNLLDALGFNRAEQMSLSNALADWVDQDTRPRSRGAEDYDYAAGEVPYRTANGLIANETELRAIKGFSRSVYLRLLPHICALPNDGLSPINPNTLKPGQGPLLVMLLGDELDVSEAEDVIATRPGDGYGGADDFWGRPAFAGINPGPGVRNQISMKTSFFTLEARITFHEAYTGLNALLEVRDNGEVTVLRRAYGSRL